MNTQLKAALYVLVRAHRWARGVSYTVVSDAMSWEAILKEWDKVNALPSVDCVTFYPAQVVGTTPEGNFIF